MISRAICLLIMVSLFVAGCGGGNDKTPEVGKKIDPEKRLIKKTGPGS